VDDIADVIDVSPADWEGRPGTVQGFAREVITGAYKISGKLLLELDTARAIDCNPAGAPAGD
jgi:purine-binding chemotaxis protein CheW